MKNKCLNPKCNHDWFPNDPNIKPKTCPRCKSYEWDNEEHWKEKEE